MTMNFSAYSPPALMPLCPVSPHPALHVPYKTLDASAFYFIYSSLQFLLLLLLLLLSRPACVFVCVCVFALCVFFSFIAASKVFNERALKFYLSAEALRRDARTDVNADAIVRFPFRLRVFPL